jgi:hypothetical protein
MSIACSVACLDCLDQAPHIGDGGFLGGPSLDLGSYDFKDWNVIPTFWTLYEPLVGLGLRTLECEEFDTWLQEHRGHRLHLSSDHDGEFPPELDRIGGTWDEKVELLKREKARAALAKQRKAEGTLVDACYHLQCRTCGVSIESPEPEVLACVETQIIQPGVASMFVERWGPSLETNDAIWRIVSPATDPLGTFVPILVDFLKQHGLHQLVASTR